MNQDLMNIPRYKEWQCCYVFPSLPLCLHKLVPHWSTSWGALKTCGYPNWTFDKTSKRSRADREEENENVTTSSSSPVAYEIVLP